MNIGAGATLVPLSRAGKVRAVAVTSATRNPELPEVPTMIENGLPELTTMTYYGIFGPPGMPADIVVRLNHEVNEILKLPEVKAGLAASGFEPTGGTPEDFAAVIAQQAKRWAPVVEATGFQME